MKVMLTDGGRIAAGFTNYAKGDCVCRSIAIITGLPYIEVHSRLAWENAAQRKSKRTGKRGRTADDGINTNRKWFKDYMRELGFVWMPTMHIGSGCKVHLRAHELPPGRLLVSVSKHLTAVIDRVIYDNHDPSRRGMRCVYGIWKYTK
jgi:hypothetical protein